MEIISKRLVELHKTKASKHSKKSRLRDASRHYFLAAVLGDPESRLLYCRYQAKLGPIGQKLDEIECLLTLNLSDEVEYQVRSQSEEFLKKIQSAKVKGDSNSEFSVVYWIRTTIGLIGMVLVLWFGIAMFMYG